MLKHLLVSLIVVVVMGYSQPASMQDVTPLPDNLKTITAANAAQLRQVDQLGQGKVVETGWSLDSKRFAVVTAAGVALYDAPNFDQQTIFIPGYTRLSRFSPDWSKVVISTADMKTQLWDLATMTALDLTEKIADPIHQDANITFTPDGSLLVVSAQGSYSYSEIAVIWDVKKQQIYGRWDAIKSTFLNGDIVMSPAGRWLTARTYEGSTLIWDIEHKQRLENLSGLYIFSHDDQLAAWSTNSYPDAQSVHIGHMPDETADVVIPIDAQQRVKQLLFTPDDRELVIHIQDYRGNGILKIWNIKQHQLRVTSTFPIDSDTTLSGFSPDGRYLLSTNYSPYSPVWDMETAQPVPVSKGFVHLTAYSPNGKYAIAQSFLWSTAFNPENKPLLNLNGSLNIYSISPDSRWLASASDKAIYLYNLRDSPLITQPALTLNMKPTYGAALFSPDGNFLLVGSQLLDGQTLKELSRIQGLYDMRSFAVDEQGHLWLAGLYESAGYGPRVALWSITRDQAQITVSEPRIFENILPEDVYPYPISLAVNGTYLVAAYGDDLAPTQIIEIWNHTRDTKPLLIYGHQEPIRDLTFSSDGRFLASGSGYVDEYEQSADDSVRLWRINRTQTTTVTETARFEPPSEVYHLKFSPDGRMIAATIFGGELYVWDTVTGKALAQLDANFDLFAFSPDGSLLAVSDWSGAIHFLDTQSWREISVAYGHIDNLASLQFRPDGRVLASSGSDGTIRFWGITD